MAAEDSRIDACLAGVREVWMILGVGRCLPLLVLALIGCTDPVPDPVPADGGTSPGSVILKIERAPAHGSIALAGVQHDQIAGQWIEAGSRPSSWWTRPDGPLSSTVHLDAPLQVGLHYFAVVSVDGNDVPDPGDLIGGPVAHRVAGRPLTLSVDRRFGADLEARPPDAGLPPGSSESQMVPVELVFEGQTAPTEPVVVLVLGRSSDDAAHADRPPSFFFRSEPTLVGPDLSLPLPSGLSLTLVLDVDGDGRPGPTDPSTDKSLGFSPPPDGSPARFVVDRLFVGPRDTAPADPSADVPVLREGGVPRTLTLRLAMELSMVKAGRILVVGYEPGIAERPDARPVYLWTSQQLRLSWPLTLDAELPEGLDVRVALDLDGSGALDAGDLCSGVLTPDGPGEILLDEVAGEQGP
jgi:hypothetical protein